MDPELCTGAILFCVEFECRLVNSLCIFYIVYVTVAIGLNQDYQKPKSAKSIRDFCMTPLMKILRNWDASTGAKLRDFKPNLPFSKNTFWVLQIKWRPKKLHKILQKVLIGVRSQQSRKRQMPSQTFESSRVDPKLLP